MCTWIKQQNTLFYFCQGAMMITHYKCVWESKRRLAKGMKKKTYSYMRECSCGLYCGIICFNIEWNEYTEI